MATSVVGVPEIITSEPTSVILTPVKVAGPKAVVQTGVAKSVAPSLSV